MTAELAPIAVPPRSAIEWAMEVLAFGGLIAGVVILIQAWPALPESVPHHFDLVGRPDAWGARGLLLLLPAIGGFVYLLLTVLAFISPRRFSFPVEITPENAARQYRLARSVLIWLKAEVVWLFTYLIWGTIRVATGVAEGLGAWLLPAALGVVFATVGVHVMMAWRRGRPDNAKG